MKARKAGLVLLETNRTRGSWCHTANISPITFRSEYLRVIHHRLRALNITVNTQKRCTFSPPLSPFLWCFTLLPNVFCLLSAFLPSSLLLCFISAGKQRWSWRGSRKRRKGRGGRRRRGGFRWVCVAAGSPQTAALCWPLLFLTLEAVCRWFTGRILQVNSPASIKGTVWV